MIVRLCKISLVFSIALLSTLVAVNNLLDPEPNFAYIAHILSMDTIPDDPLQWRAIASPVWHRVAYVLIVGVELLTGILCFAGAFQLARAIAAPAASFNRAKAVAILGLTVGMSLWLVGFLAIGGEWFLMWRSSGWNAQQPAFRFLGAIGLVLLFVSLEDGERV